ncbi:MAG: hypothetical protein IKB23_04735 [Clostridia bacterium]|nr:hypothetical protein [Clostridia bacterium]
MKKILEELWYGNVCPDTQSHKSSKESKKLMGYVVEHHEALNETLTEKQKEILEKLDDCYADLTSENERDVFVYAFKLGARMALEIMSFKVE